MKTQSNQRRISGLLISIVLVCGIFSPLMAVEIGIRGGMGFSDFSKGQYDLTLNSGCDIVALEKGLEGGATLDTIYVKMTSQLVLPAVMEREYSYYGGMYARFKLSQHAIKDESGYNRLNFRTELNWQRETARFGFGTSITSELTGFDDTTLSQLVSVQGVIDQLAMAVMDTTQSSSSRLTLDYIQIPLMLELYREFDVNDPAYKMASAYLHFGPAFQYCISAREVLSGTVSNAVGLMYDAYSFAVVPNMDTTYVQIASRETTSEFNLLSRDIRKLPVSFILGCGIEIKDLFKMGIGSDRFCIDVRADLGLTGINTLLEPSFKVNSLNILLGYKF